MDKKTINFNSSISGKYIIEVKKADGSIIKPFGEEPLKNLILDTFFDSVLNGGHAFASQSYMQSCRVGGGPGSDIPVNRTQLGLQGEELMITHLGDTFTGTVSGSSSEPTIILQRVFTFDVNNTQNPISCREAVVGCFNSSVTGMDITLSRFVFPEDVIINSGDQLRIAYTLSIKLRYVYENIPVNLNSNGINLNGILRYTGGSRSLISSPPGSYSFLVSSPGLTTIIGANGGGTTNQSLYYYRRHNVGGTNTNSFFSTTTNSYAGGTHNIFGMPVYSSQWSTLKIGFFSDNPSTLVTYPNGRPSSYTLSGPNAIYTLGNYQKNDNYASIDVSYYFPSHTSDRAVWGAYLWYLTDTSESAIYLRLTENDFITDRSVTIPANIPIAIKLRYTFSRE